MKNKEIRLQNLLLLLEKYDSKQAFADAVDMAPAHVSQIVNGFRFMGDKIARRIEEKEGLPTGYMDIIHDDYINSLRLVSEDNGKYDIDEPLNEELVLLILDAIEEHLTNTGQSFTNKEIQEKMVGLYKDFVYVKDTITKPVLVRILEIQENTG